MSFSIGERIIDENAPTYIIAELSCNHNQQFDLAMDLVRAAKASGADAVKLQTYTADTITLDCDNEHFQIKAGTLWDGMTLHQLYSRASTPWEWTKPLMEEAKRLGMDCFSSPFDVTAVDYLEKLDVPCYKVASFEVCDHVLLKRIAETGKPVIMSSGVSDLSELAESVQVLRNHGCKQLCLLKCTSAYPAPIEQANLKTIRSMADTFGVISGLSDHTTGIEVPVAAVCLGARVIEKHFKAKEDSGSEDDAFSLTPSEFKQMVESIRKVEKAIGNVQYRKEAQEKKNQKFKRSLFVVQDVAAGERFTEENVKSIRPGDGLHTRHYDYVMSSTASEDITRGTPLSWKLLANISS